jgi:hypothetical protein
MPTCVLYGSAELGLDFLHIEIPEDKEQDIFSKHVGIVYIEAGEIKKEDLLREFTAIYKTTWPWQIRQLEECGYPCFGLVK